MPRIYHRRCLIMLFQLILVILLTEHYFRSKPFIKKFNSNHRENYNTLVPHLNFSEQVRISEIVNYLNAEERILNVEEKRYSQEKIVIIVVLVDNNSADFLQFLSSLSEVTGIQDALIVFSHAVFDDTLNSFIREIEFCPVLQIFYPYSVQTHSNKFPGFHKDDCPSDMTIQFAEKINCTGAFSPDNKGRYRDPLLSERKQHWWWTANQVFEKIKCTKNHKGIAIFMEDNLIFTKDFIYMATFMENLARTVPRCELVSLGTPFAPNMRYVDSNIYAAKLTVWEQKLHSVLGFNASTWEIISAHYDLFCDFDDASWLRSLSHISRHRKKVPNFKVIASEIPRAFTIDHCKGFGCGYTTVEKITKWLNKTEELWFPLYVELSYEIWKDLVPPAEEDTPEGGWADPRDKALCVNITQNKMRKVIMEILYEH